MNRLICANSRFITRYWRIRLPSEPEEPEEPEDPETEARLRSLLGLEKITYREGQVDETDPIS